MQRKSWSDYSALFMLGGFALSSMGDETWKTVGVSAEAQLTQEKQPPLCDKKGQFSERDPPEVKTWTTRHVE